MVRKIFAIWDKEMGIFSHMVIMNHVIEMTRSIAAIMREQKGALYENHGSMALHCLGDIDAESGVLRPNADTFICNISDFLKKEDDNTK